MSCDKVVSSASYYRDELRKPVYRLTEGFCQHPSHPSFAIAFFWQGGRAGRGQGSRAGQARAGQGRAGRAEQDPARPPLKTGLERLGP